MARTVGKKIAFGFAIFCVIGMVASIVSLFFTAQHFGAAHPITASSVGFIIFFGSCAVVLWTMSQPRRQQVES